MEVDVERWKADPVTFFEDGAVRDPETSAPFQLYPAERQFLRRALTLKPDGTLPYPELVFAAPKKSGKTALAAMIVLFVILILAGPYGEAIIVANDFEQAQGRVFKAIARMLGGGQTKLAKVTQSCIEFPSTGSTIIAIANDYAGAAGANPNIVVFDELWAYTSERSRRLWDELCPVPTRRVSVRLTVTYAGYSGESELLEELYKRGLTGEVVTDEEELAVAVEND